MLLVQEHCLYDSQIHTMKSLARGAEVKGKSSMNENIMLEGRPFGGCAIVYIICIIVILKVK